MYESINSRYYSSPYEREFKQREYERKMQEEFERERRYTIEAIEKKAELDKQNRRKLLLV